MSRFTHLGRLLPLMLTACYGLTPIEAVVLDTLEPDEREQVELGRALFFDPGLSGAGDVSCASCHDPAFYGAEPRATSVGTGGVVLSRNAPSVFNGALRSLQFWDGRAATLEEQARGPLFAPEEMGQTEQGLVAHVAEAYADRMEASVGAVTSALAAYQRSLPSPSRYDRYLSGERDALDAQERRGLRVFRARCAWCHGGPGLGGDQLRVLGTATPWHNLEDRGVYDLTGEPEDDMVFAVPPLRNVAQTAPYFHDGSVDTLEEAVVRMGVHQLGVEFSEDKVADLVAFLGALDAEEVPPWAFPPL